MITTNVGKTVEYIFDEKEITIPGELSGTGQDQVYSPKNRDMTFYVWAEDNDYIFLIGNANITLSFQDTTGFSNFVGIIDAVGELLLSTSKYHTSQIRGIRLDDLNQVATSSGWINLKAKEATHNFVPAIAREHDYVRRSTKTDTTYGSDQPSFYSGLTATTGEGTFLLADNTHWSPSILPAYESPCISMILRAFTRYINRK